MVLHAGVKGVSERSELTPCNIYIYILYYITSIKNNCLKLKNEVGMAVLKSKQTRVVASYIEIISTYIYSTSLCLLF